MKIHIHNGWTANRYGIFRFLLGAYVFVQCAIMIPWAPEVYSSAGMIPDAATSPLTHIFPNFLAFWDSPIVVQLALGFGATLGLALAFGFRDRWAALFLWYLWACLYGRNPLTANPSMPYVGWLLLAHAALPPPRTPAHEAAASLSENSRSANPWTAHAELFTIAWILMAVGYTYSGLTKLTAPSWVNGMAVQYVLENPLARPGFIREFFLAFPEPLLRLITWGTLFFEIFFAPLALSRRLRPWLWTGMVAMHLGLIVLIDFASLTFGMLVLHAFTFDPGWAFRFSRLKNRAFSTVISRRPLGHQGGVS